MHLLAATLAALLGAVSAQSNRWLNTSILLARVGDGSCTQACSVYFDEVVVNSTYGNASSISSSWGPIAPGGIGGRQCTLTNTYPRDGWIQRSADGRFISVMCLDLAYNAAWPGSSTATVNKTLALIGADGSFDTTTSSVNAYENSNYYLHTSITNDGTSFWTAGSSSTGGDVYSGVRWIPKGGTQFVALNTTLGANNYDTRYVTVFNGQVYASFADLNKRGVYKFGNGLPNTTGTQATILPGFMNYQTQLAGSNPNDLQAFVFENATSLWLNDNSNVAAAHVWNYVVNASSGLWTRAASVKFNTTDLAMSITGRPENGYWTLYVITYVSGTGAVWRYVPLLGVGATAPLATNPMASTKWRGVMLPPQNPAFAYATVTATLSASATVTATRTSTPTLSTSLSTTATGTPTRTPTISSSTTGSQSATNTVTSTGTSSSSQTATSSSSQTTTPTDTASPSISYGASPSITPSSSATLSSTETPTSTSSITASSSSTSSSSVTSTTTSTASRTPSSTPTSSLTPTATPSSKYQRWESTSILVQRVGDGTASCQGACGVFFDEIVTDARVGIVGSVSTTFGPITASPGGRQCTLTNYYPRDGWSQRSADGRFISVLCLDMPFSNAASGWPGTSTTTYKTLALIGADGTVDTSTAGLNAYQNSNYYLHSSVTNDGASFWTAGASLSTGDIYSGIRYIAKGGTAFAALNTTLGANNYDCRYTTIYGGQLYGAFADTGIRGVYKMGSGLPTTAGTHAQMLPGFEQYQTQMVGSSPNELGGFVFENSTSLWLIDNANLTAAHVWQYVVNGVTGKWTRAASVRFSTTDVAMAITGRFETAAGALAPSFVVYAVTYVYGDVGSLWRVDTAAFDGAVGVQVITTPLVTNPTTNSMWRSVILPPVDISMDMVTSSTTPTSTASSTPSASLTSTSTPTTSATRSSTASSSSTMTSTSSSSTTSSGSFTPSAGASSSGTPTLTPSSSGSVSITPSATQSATSTVTPRYMRWQSTSILVQRVGDGTASCQGACGVFFDEVIPTSAYGIAGSVATKFGPISASPGGRQCTLTNSYPRDGWSQRSADGRFISVLCLDMPFSNAASGWPGNSTTTYKTLALIGADGTVDTSTAGLNAYQNSNYYLYTSITNDGTSFWTAGASLSSGDIYSGIRYIAKGGTAFTALNTTLGANNYDCRYTTIYGGQLYGAFADTGIRGVYKMGSGLPTAAGTHAQMLPGFEQYQTQMVGSSPNELAGFVFANSTSLWLIDNANVATAHIWQYVYFASSGKWNRAASIRFTTTDVAMAITGRMETYAGIASFVVYAITYVSGDGGSLWRVDTALAGAPTVYVASTPLATNPTANSMWRSVLLPPVDPTFFAPSPSSTPQSTVSSTTSSTETPSMTSTQSATASLTALPSVTRTSTATSTSTSSNTASITPSASITASITASSSASISAGATASSSPSDTPTSSETSSATSSSSATGTSTPTGSNTASLTPSSSETRSASATVSPRYMRWEPTSILVQRVGDGTASCQGACGVLFDEIVTDARVGIVGSVSTTFGPITASPGGRQCTLTNSYPRDGWSQRSADGRFISVLCLDMPFSNAASGWPGTSTTTYKTLALIGADGTVDTSTAGLNAYENSNYYLHTSITNDGTSFWTAGASLSSGDIYSGIRYIAKGGTAFTALNTTLGANNYDCRYTTIYGGQLYGAFADTGIRGVYKMGSGLPTAAGTHAQMLPGFEQYQTQMAGSNPNELGGFVFENSTSLWLIDNANLTAAHVWQYVVNGVTGKWTRAASVRFSTTDLAMAITGRFETAAGALAPSFVVYAVTYISGDVGSLWRVDTAAFDGAVGVQVIATPLVTNPTANSMWRSVILPPVNFVLSGPTPTHTPTQSGTMTATSSTTASTSGTRTQTPTSSSTRTQTKTPSETPSNTKSVSVTRTNSPPASRTPPSSVSSTLTASPSTSATASVSASQSSTSSVSGSGSATETSTPSSSATAATTATETRSATGSRSPTRSASETTSSTRSASTSGSLSTTASSSASVTSSDTAVSTPSGTSSSSGSASGSMSGSASATVSAAVTRSVTRTTAKSMSATRTKTATESSTRTSTPSGSSTATPTPSSPVTPTASPSDSLTGSPVATATQTGSVTPTAAVTRSATETGTPSKTGSAPSTPTRTGSAPPTPSKTPSKTSTSSFSSTKTSSLTRTSTRTASGSKTPSRTPSVTRSPSPTRSASRKPKRVL